MERGDDYARMVRALILLKACLQALMLAEAFSISLVDEDGECTSVKQLSHHVLSSFDYELYSKKINE